MQGERREGIVIVRGAATGVAQEIIAGPHQFLSDEPTTMGGTDTGPMTDDLLLAAIGSCTSMTIAITHGASSGRWSVSRFASVIRASTLKIVPIAKRAGRTHAH